MKILIDLSVMELPPTGITRVVTGLYGALTARDPTLDVRGVHRRRLLSIPPLGIRTARTAPFLPYTLWRRFALPNAVRHPQSTIFHFPWNGKVPRLPREVRTITTLHDVLPLIIPGYFSHEELEQVYRRERQADIDRSDVVVTDSEFSKSEIVRHFRLNRDPIVIYCATDICAFVKEASEKRDPYFLYVGGLDTRKSVDLLLRVFCSLAAKGTLHSKLIVAGSRRHAPDQITALLDDGVRRGYVSYVGYVDDRTLASLYAGALALVYPSQYEGFGMPPLEAMSLGCPVITCRSTSIPEVCGEAAYYTEPRNEKSLAEALITIERDETLRRRFASEGRTRAALFSWDRAAEKFLQILESFLHPSAKGML